MDWEKNHMSNPSEMLDYVARPSNLVELSHPLVKHHITLLRTQQPLRPSFAC